MTTRKALNAAPDPGIFERGDAPLAVIYSITNFFSFLMKLYKIIEPRLLKKRGLKPPDLLDPALAEHHRQRTVRQTTENSQQLKRVIGSWTTLEKHEKERQTSFIIYCRHWGLNSQTMLCVVRPLHDGQVGSSPYLGAHQPSR